MREREVVSCSALSKDEDHKMKLSTKQSEDADPLKEEGEEGKATLRDREVVSCTDPHEDGSEEGKATLKGREVVRCCSNKHKYLFGIPVDEQTMKFSTGPRMGSSKTVKKKVHRAGTRWIQLQRLPTVRAKEEKKLKMKERMKDDESEKEEVKERRKGNEEKYPPLDAAIPGRRGKVPT